MPTKSKRQKSPERVAIINAVKTYIGFFVLIVLVIESVLGAVALNTEGRNQLVALYGMLFIVLVLIGVVSFFAYRKPYTLLRSFAGHDTQEMQLLQDFCTRISGHWWEPIKPDKFSAISFVEIRPDVATHTVKMKGNVYNKEGKFSATWESVACCINHSERKIFYYWQGRDPLRLNEPYEGFGEVSFHEFSGRIDSGIGIFSDTNVTDMKSTTKKSMEFRRSAASEIQVMQEGNDTFISEMVRKKLGHPV